MVQSVYIESRAELILRTEYKGKMLRKLKKMRYEHLENKQSFEIIDKAYGRAETAAMHLFPKYICNAIMATVACSGIVLLFVRIRWWFIITLLTPFILERIRSYQNSFNIYDEMETYWQKEIQYEKLENLLLDRKAMRENRLMQSTGFLINTFKERVNERNREYERFYFLNLYHHFGERNISRFGQLINAILLLMVYRSGSISFTQFVALTMAIFTTLAQGLSHFTYIVANMGYHIKAFEYYDKFFELSEDDDGEINEIPNKCSIEFKDVSFTYPGSDKEIISHMSFRIESGEKVSIVGMNGEGKTTLIKLLLGLFEPTHGMITIADKPLHCYTRKVRERIFGPVFQDFVRYSISLSENVGIGEIDKISDKEAIREAIIKGNVESFVNQLPDKENTILNRDFKGGIDLSGGQWQRIAIARALMGDKPILILDEPTSQLDPMAESELYSEFAKMAKQKTALFITHRLGSTRITDRILVVSNGKIAQQGTHDELLKHGGLYSDMWNAQKQWYTANRGEDL